LHLDVLAVAQRRDDRRIGRRPADAVFLERLDERRLRVARRRLREVLLADDALEDEAVALGHGRQHAVIIVLRRLRIVEPFLVDGDEARADEHRSGRAEDDVTVGRRTRREIHGDGVVYGRIHLRSDGALPDQLVEPILIVVEIAAEILRRALGRRRADRLVLLLRVLRLRRIAARRLGKVLLAVALRDHAAQLVERLVRERDRVGAHVRDQTDRALADVDALIEALRDRHRLLRAEAELARRFLLQRRRRERRGRIPAALLLLDRGDREDADRIRGHVAARRARLDAALRVARRGLVRERELLDLRAFEYREPRLERLVGVPHRGFDRPVLLRLERRDLVLALDEQPERRALHGARGPPPP